MCVSVCKYVYALNNVGLREFTPRYSRSKGRTHCYSGTHTKSSTIAIKSKAISLLLANYTQRALTRVHTHTLKVTNTIKHIVRLLGKCEKTLGEINDIRTVHPLHTWIKCVSSGSIRSLNESFFGIGDMEKNQFQGQVWCQGRPEGHSSVDQFISICSLLKTENPTVCSAASLRNIAQITVP